MSAKAEIASYTTSTGFGGRQPREIQPPIPRPAKRAEALRQIRAIYAGNKWDESEQAVNHEMNGLPVKALDDYTNDELKVILDDMEKRRMIIYEP